MRRSIESVIDSYEERVKTVSSLIRQTVEVLKQFDLEQEEKIAGLQDLLARARSLRRKDFDNLMAEIQARRREKGGKVAHAFDSFLREQEELVAWLRKVASNGNMGLEEFNLLSQNMLARQKDKEKELGRMLRELHLEQEELATGLKRLLQKGEKVRIKDFKAMVKALKLRQEERQSEVGKLLEELGVVGEEVSEEWRRVMTATKV